MSLATDLMGVGLPQEQATRLGYTAATTLAGVGTSQSGARTIPNMVNNVAGTTTGGQTAFVVDAAVELTMPYLFRNTSSTTALLFPPVGGAFNAGSDNASISVAQNQSILFWRQTATKFVAFSTSEPNILSTANTWTAVQTFSDKILARGTSPAIFQTQGAPTAKTVTSAISAAELLTGIITSTGATGPSVHQLPTGTALAAAITGIAVGDSFDWSLINTGTGASDDAVVSANTDHTIVGNGTVGALTDATIISGSGRFRTRYTAANTFVTYRLA